MEILVLNLYFVKRNIEQDGKKNPEMPSLTTEESKLECSRVIARLN
jgi:hypothetical protein